MGDMEAKLPNSIASSREGPAGCFTYCEWHHKAETHMTAHGQTGSQRGIQGSGSLEPTQGSARSVSVPLGSTPTSDRRIAHQVACGSATPGPSF